MTILARAEPIARAIGSADFAVPDDAIEAALRRHVRKTFDVGDLAWREELAKAIGTRRLGLRRSLRRVFASSRNARDQSDVRAGYEGHWEQMGALERYVVGLDERTLCAVWQNRGMHLAPQALRQSHLLYLMRAIEVLTPRHVLDVGFGNGNIILVLAARFPGVAFNGVELTGSGLAIARAMQSQIALPPSFAERSPEPLQDLTAHRGVELSIGNARALPFPDRAFDLVYTRLALEQMEAIRRHALREIARVAGRAVVLLEPWRDFNLRDPGRAYIRRQGYFSARISDLTNYGLEVMFSTADLPQKVQFNSGPVVAMRVADTVAA